ncbi:hypothetical protein [Aliikangiella sp. G2MR2-5]|uniref:hypothetical protein n=1 Tax=Aliikangiella sp. G2MR2-5 TaxID=2788943 RepID=UPI0018A9AD2C|nr:hypothetical protein [Aliikangiella sp. G2MR2-5]
MLRDFSTVLIDLQQALVEASEKSKGMISVLDAEMKIPIDMRVIFRDGEAVLLGDVPRSIEDANWFDELSSLKICWQQTDMSEQACTRNSKNIRADDEPVLTRENASTSSQEENNGF